MLRGGDGQHKISDYVEEETKIRKNLSRLIHTVQHIPSCRDKLDTNSLWNLVRDLESFDPVTKTKSMQLTLKTRKTSFSRQYLNLRLCPSPDRSLSPEYERANYESKTKDIKQIPINDFPENKSKRSKKINGQKRQEEVSSHVRAELTSKPLVNKYYIYTKPRTNRNSKNPSSVVCDKDKQFRGNIERCPRSSTRSKGRQTENSKNEEKDSSTSKTTFGIHYNDNMESINHNGKFKVLDKIKGTKVVDCEKNDTQQYFKNNRPVKTLDLNRKCLSESHSSIVKKLTNYWDNLVNSELEDINSESETFEVPHINKSIHNLARKIYHEAEKNKRKTVTEPRDDLEPNKTVFEKLQNLSFDSSTSYKSGKILHQTNGYSSETDTEDNHNKSSDKLCSILENESVLEEKISNEIFKDEYNMTSNTECNLMTSSVIKILRKLIFKLKKFPDASITSEQITLSQSVKAMLCLMTATMVSSADDITIDDLECESVDKGTNCEDSSNPTNEQTPLSSLHETSSLFNDKYKINILTRNYQIVPIEGVTLSKVEDALRYLELCKDYLWTKFISKHRTFSNNEDRTPQHLFSAFAFVLEGEVDLENESDEEEHGSETEDGSYQEDDFTTIWSTCELAAVYVMEKLIDLTADFIVLNWPESIEDFMKSLYHASITILVWWIIIKELFLK